MMVTMPSLLFLATLAAGDHTRSVRVAGSERTYALGPEPYFAAAPTAVALRIISSERGFLA